MIGAIGAGVNLVTGIVKGIIAKKAHDDYANKLGKIEMKMPGAIGQAEAIRTDMAYGDMPGFSTMMGDVDAGTAGTMTQAKQMATSPAALMDALIQSSTAGEQQKRGLGTQNAMFKNQNQNLLARFYSTIKSPAEQKIIQFDIDKEIAINKEQMEGTKELMGGIEGGIGSAFSAFGSGKQLGFMSDRNEMMKQYWQTGGGMDGSMTGGMDGSKWANPNGVPNIFSGVSTGITNPGMPNLYPKTSGFGGWG